MDNNKFIKTHFYHHYLLEVQIFVSKKVLIELK